MQSQSNQGHQEYKLISTQAANPAIIAYLCKNYEQTGKQKGTKVYSEKFGHLFFEKEQKKVIINEYKSMFPIVVSILEETFYKGLAGEYAYLESKLNLAGLPSSLLPFLWTEIQKLLEKTQLTASQQIPSSFANSKANYRLLADHMKKAGFSGDYLPLLLGEMSQPKIQDDEMQINIPILQSEGEGLRLGLEKTILAPEIKEYLMNDPNLRQRVHEMLNNAQGFIQQKHTEGKPEIHYLTDDGIIKIDNQALDIKIKERLSEYMRLGQLSEDDLVYGQMESSIGQVGNFWLIGFIDNFLKMITNQLATHQLFMNRLASMNHPGSFQAEELISQTANLYAEDLQSIKFEFEVIHNAMLEFDFLYPIHYVQESKVFAQDIRAVSNHYYEGLFAYLNYLWARATSIEKPIIQEYTLKLINSIMPFIHRNNSEKNSSPTLNCILRHRLDLIYKNFNEDIDLDSDHSKTSLSHTQLLNTSSSADIHFAHVIYSKNVDHYNQLYDLKEKISRKITPQTNAGPKKGKPTAKPQKKKKPKKKANHALPKKQDTATKTPISYQPNRYERKVKERDESSMPIENNDDWITVSYKKKIEGRGRSIDNAVKEISQGHYQTAIDTFNHILQDAKTTAKDIGYANYGLARAYFIQGDAKKAFEYLNKIVEADETWKENYHFQLLYARICILDQDFPQGLSVLSTMLLRWKNDPVILKLLSKYHSINNDYCAALSIGEWLKNKTSDPFTLVNLAYNYLHHGDIDSASRVLNEVLPEDREKEMVVLARADVLLRDRQYKQALSLLQKYTNNFTNNGRIINKKHFYKIYLKATSRQERAKFPKVWQEIQAFDWAANIDFQLLKFFHDFHSNNKKKAYELLLEIYKKWPENSKVLRELSRYHFHHNHFAEGIRFAELGIQADPGCFTSHAFLLRNMQKFPEKYSQEYIIAKYEEFINKKDIRSYKFKLKLYHEYGHHLLNTCHNPEAAEKIIRAGLQNYPSPILVSLLIKALMAQSNYIKANEELKRGMLQYPKDHVLKMLQGEIDVKIEDEASLKQRNLFAIELSKNPALIEKNQAVSQTDNHSDIKELRLTEAPPHILSAFSDLEKLTSHVALNGSTQHKLAENALADTMTSLDFVMDCSPEALIKNIPGIKRDGDNSNFFSFELTYQGIGQVTVNIRLYQSPESKENLTKLQQEAQKSRWLLSVALLSDFSIDSLVTTKTKDNHLIIHDPVEKGLAHIQNKILDINSYGPLVFEKNPLSLLRAALRMVKGYQATEDIKYALTHWSGNGRDIFYTYMLSLIANHLYMNPLLQVDYVKLLHEYGLLLKIFRDDIPMINQNLQLEQIDQAFVDQLRLEMDPIFKRQLQCGFSNNAHAEDNAELHFSQLFENMSFSEEKRKAPEKNNLVLPKARGIMLFSHATNDNDCEKPIESDVYQP